MSPTGVWSPRPANSYQNDTGRSGRKAVTFWSTPKSQELLDVGHTIILCCFQEKDDVLRPRRELVASIHTSLQPQLSSSAKEASPVEQTCQFIGY